MDIAALSTVMKQGATMQKVDIAVAKKVMDTAIVNGEALTRMMEQSVNPNLGKSIDIKV